jgi:hypothetical protein
MRCGFRPPPAQVSVTVRLVVLLLALLTVPAAAQPQPPEVRPWAEGVPEEKQALALAAYDAGNAEFVESRFAQALAKYREALAHWDHPAIRFNMVVCLINLDQLLEARESLERALAFGPAPLGAELHQQALTYRKLLEGRLTRVTIRCDEPGAEVSLDGITLFVAPGEATRWVTPGKHQLVAMKAYYLPMSETLDLDPGTTPVVACRLYANITATRTTRRWSTWKPYAVAGAGMFVAGLGGIAHALAARDYRAYDDAIRVACPRGCSAAEAAALGDERAIRSVADSRRTAAIALFALGGALTVAGGAALYLNQPRTEVVSPVTPGVVAGPGGVVLTLDGSF